MTSTVVGIPRHAVCFPLPVIIRYLQYHHTNREKIEILTYGLSHTQYAISVLSWNFASDRLKDEDDSLKI